MSRYYLQIDAGGQVTVPKEAAAFGIAPYSVEFWLRTEAADATLIDVDGSGDYMTVALDGSGRIVWTYGTPAGSETLTSADAVHDGHWHHVVLVRHYNASSQDAIAVDASVTLAEVPSIDRDQDMSADLTIGGGPVIDLDGLAFYNAALDADTTAEYYNAGNGRLIVYEDANLAAGWNFNEGKGTLAGDVKGNYSAVIGSLSTVHWQTGQYPIIEYEPENEFDQLLADSAVLFLELGEAVTYYPMAGGSRTIKAVVTRGEYEPPGNIEAHTPVTTIDVANSTDSGISSAEINTGGDEIELAFQIGGPKQRRKITRLVRHDAGMMTLEVR